MPKQWEINERLGKQFLEEHYGYLASFELYGGSNANVSDIQAISNNNGNSFFIESKKDDARGGSFVADPDFDTGRLVPASSTPKNEPTLLLLDYINKRVDFDFTSEGGYTIEAPAELTARWIVEHYQKKSAEFILVPDKSILDVFRLVALDAETLIEAFDMKLQIYRKRHGDHHLSKKWHNAVRSVVAEMYSEQDLEFRSEVRFNSKGKPFYLLYVRLNEDHIGQYKNKTFWIGEKEFILVWQDEHQEYEIKTRGKLPENYTVLPELNLRKNCCVDSSPKLVEMLS